MAPGNSGWALRETSPTLRRHYLEQGWWTDDRLGGVIARRLDELGSAVEVRIWSKTRPWRSPLAVVADGARRLSGALAARGIGPGDVVSFQIANWVEAAIAFWGTAMTGATLVPIVHFYGPREVAHVLRETRARAHISVTRFGHVDHLEMIDGLWRDLPDLELVAFVRSAGAPGPGGATGSTDPAEDGRPLPRGAVELASLLAEADSAAAEGPPIVRTHTITADSPALIAYTSGTTAHPKGVIHTHRSLLAELRQLSAMNGSGARPQLTGAPVSHFMGMLGGLLLCLLRGDGVFLIDQWDPPTILDAMVEADLGAGSGSTFLLTSLLDAPGFGPEHLERMRFVGMGGSPIPNAVAERATRLGISIVRSYGSTELPSTTGASHDEPRAKRLTTDGHAMPGVEIRIVDVDGRDVAPGTPGEVLARAPELFAGYTDPALTASAFAHGDGWYATGDVAVVDDDGWLTITDRTRDIVIRGGLNLSPAEIEDVLQRMPGVAEVAVVAAPDERYGEHACAFVRTVPGAVAPDLDTVAAFFAANDVPRQKWPEEVRAIDEFPRTASGKIKKFELRDTLRAGGG
jgi:acyl-CoA synthetase